MKWLKLLWLFLKDERGFWGQIAAAVAPSVLGYLGQKKRGKPQGVGDFQWTGAEGLKGKFSENILGRIGAPSQYKYQPQFGLQQPGVEKAAEGTIMGKLGQPPTVSGYSADITAKHYAARKERLGERHEEEVRQVKDMYNRLGLVSSTPGMKGVSDIRRQHGLELEDISSQLMYEDIQREMDANKLVEDIMLAWTGQAQALGGAQRGYEQFGMKMSMADLERQLGEEQMYGGQAMQYLGMGAPSPKQGYQSRMFQWGQPNAWDYALGAMQSPQGQGLMTKLGQIGTPTGGK